MTVRSTMTVVNIYLSEKLMDTKLLLHFICPNLVYFPLLIIPNFAPPVILQNPQEFMSHHLGNASKVGNILETNH